MSRFVTIDSFLPVAFRPRKSGHLRPIAWGRKDRDLGRLVCQSLVATTPPIVIPADPRTHAALRAFLTTNAIATD